MPRAGRGPASPGPRLLAASVVAMVLHVVVLYLGSGPVPVFTRSERQAPMSVRVIPPVPLPDHVSVPRHTSQPKEQVARPRPAPPAASGVDSPTTEASRGYDVPPVPEHGWNVVFQAIDPSADADTVALVEMEVSAQGQIRHWRIVESNTPLEATAALLHGVETTPMLPAVRDGEAVDAIVRYELRFLRVPSN